MDMRFDTKQLTLVALVMLAPLGGCDLGGKEIGEDASDDASEGDGACEGDDASEGTDTNEGDDTQDTANEGEDTSSTDCEEAIAGLDPLINSEEGGCMIVARFDSQTLAPLGFHPTCGAQPGTFLEEAEARELSECCGGGERISPADDIEVMVFYEQPADFGGVFVFSNHMVETAFEATMVWDGQGEILEPTQWEDPELMGSGCDPAIPAFVRSYDLINGGNPIPEEDLQPLLAAVFSTALVPAMLEAPEAELRVTDVFLYGRDGEGNPEDQEYIVLLSL